MSKKQDNNFIRSLILRYIILVLIAIPNLYLFYKIFTPLTFFPVYFLLDLFFETVKINYSILIDGKLIEIISSCIAGSAYYLILILNLTIPNIKISKRLKMILFGFGIFLIINILRITILSVLFFNDYIYFDFIHKFFWYFVSIIMVLFIWFLEVKIFKLKQVPIYSDIKKLKSFI